MFQRVKIIAVVSLAIGMLLTTNIIMACPAGQAPCGENSCCRVAVPCHQATGQAPCGTDGCCECDVSFTTENGEVECLMDITDIFVIRCSVLEFIKNSGYSDVTVEFNKIPSLRELDIALTAECGNQTKCAEKFQCQKHGGCPLGSYQCEPEVCCPV